MPDLKRLFNTKDIPMTALEGRNVDDFSDFSVRKHIDLISGTVDKAPSANKDIANKKYVDDQTGGGVNETITVSGGTLISGAMLFASGANINITQNGQQVKWSVIGVPTGSGTSTGTNTGDQTIYPTTINASGASVISGAVVFASGANIDIVQTGQQIKIIGLATPSTATTIKASGASTYAVSGAVLLASGANIDITQAGQQIKIAAIGLPSASDWVKVSSATIASQSSISFANLSTTDYLTYVLDLAVYPDSGTFTAELELNNDQAGYAFRSIDAANAIVDSGSSANWDLITSGQGLTGKVFIDVKRIAGGPVGGETFAHGLIRDGNSAGGATFLNGEVAIAADTSNIKLLFSAASSGTARLYGIK